MAIASLDACRFKIYIRETGGDNWKEISTAVNNYSRCESSTVNGGMKFNTCATFTANDEDEICICYNQTQNVHGGTVTTNNGSDNYFLKIDRGDKAGGGSHGILQSSIITKLKDTVCKYFSVADSHAGTMVTIPTSTGTVLNSSWSGNFSGSSSSITKTLYIKIGKNNMGWNVFISDNENGMGTQGSYTFPDNSIVENPLSTSATDYKNNDYHMPINIKKNGKAGWTQIGWYKQWNNYTPKLIDIFNIVDKVYYYDGLNNIYKEISKSTGSAGNWDGPSSGNAGGALAIQNWNIDIRGQPLAVWVKCSKTITDFKDNNANDAHPDVTLPKAPWVYIDYK